MKRKSPISVDRIQFCIYSQNQIEELSSVDQLPYDDRNDFLAEKSIEGIAVKIEFSNERLDKGTRRNVVLDFIDTTTRCVTTTKVVKLNISKNEYLKVIYVDFQAGEIKSGHTYKLRVSDTTASQTLSERTFHLIDESQLPAPYEWYEVCDCGIRPAWEDNLYKTLRTIDGQDYYVRFNIAQKFGAMLPPVLPELELRLYYPEMQQILTSFCEPICKGIYNYKENNWFVEYQFTTSPVCNGVFYAELLCMEYPIAGFAFDSNVEDEHGTWFGPYIQPLEEYTPDAANKLWASYPAPAGESHQIMTEDDFDKLIDSFIAEEKAKADPGLENEEITQETETVNTSVSLLPSLDSLTGLRAVKEKLSVYEHVVRFNKLRTERGLPSPSTPLHAMFLGSPGTGKTTVAKIIGTMLHRAGMLSKGHVVVRERAQLLGQNYNSESEKTLQALEEAQGGILFIDEAYQLYQPNDSRDPGKFVIETLLTALSDEQKRDWMLILAGYPDEMKRMFELNPGFKSRIPESNIYVFDDFSESELIEIAENYLSRYQYILTDEARTALHDRLRLDYKHRNKTFGNARHVINMIQTEIIPSMAIRVTNESVLSDNSLSEIISADIPRYTESITDIPRSRVGFH